MGTGRIFFECNFSVGIVKYRWENDDVDFFFNLPLPKNFCFSLFLFFLPSFLSFWSVRGLVFEWKFTQEIVDARRRYFFKGSLRSRRPAQQGSPLFSLFRRPRRGPSSAALLFLPGAPCTPGARENSRSRDPPQTLPQPASLFLFLSSVLRPPSALRPPPSSRWGQWGHVTPPRSRVTREVRLC